jgi:hypothetical protein
MRHVVFSGDLHHRRRGADHSESCAHDLNTFDRIALGVFGAMAASIDVGGERPVQLVEEQPRAQLIMHLRGDPSRDVCRIGQLAPPHGVAERHPLVKQLIDVVA